MPRKHPNGTQMLCIKNRETFEHEDFKKGTIYTILHSKKYPGTYEFKNLKGEQGWHRSLVEDGEYFTLAEITNWQKHMERG